VLNHATIKVGNYAGGGKSTGYLIKWALCIKSTISFQEFNCQGQF